MLVLNDITAIILCQGNTCSDSIYLNIKTTPLISNRLVKIWFCFVFDDPSICLTFKIVLFKSFHQLLL